MRSEQKENKKREGEVRENRWIKLGRGHCRTEKRVKKKRRKIN